MAHLFETLRITMQQVKNSYDTFCGTGANLAIAFLALFFLFCSLRNRHKSARQDVFLLWLCAAAAGVIVCPVSAWFIMKYCIESTVYRRMFWMIPFPLLVGYAGARIVTGEQAKKRKFFTGVFLSAIIAVTGVNLYHSGNFTEAENLCKLLPGVISVSDAIEKDASERETEDVGAIVTDELAIQLRQYDASIRMPYGRDAVRGNSVKKQAAKIYRALHQETPDAQSLAFYAKHSDYGYLAYWADEALLPSFLSAGYELAADADGYFVYRLRPEAVSDLLITRYGSKENGQMTFCTIETSGKKLIVVDCGTETDESYMREAVLQKGKRVNAWILTSCQKGHAEVFSNIVKNPGKLKIKHIFTVQSDEADAAIGVREAETGDIKVLHAGDQRKIAGVLFRVFCANDSDENRENPLMLEVLGETKSMLFGTDADEEMSGQIVERDKENRPVLAEADDEAGSSDAIQLH